MVIRSFVLGLVVLSLGGCCFGGIPGMPGAPGAPGTPAPGTGTTPTVPPVAVPAVGGAMVTIAPGFMPDPQTASGSSGGPIDASTMNSSCRGYIAAQPNHVVNATGQFANLRIIVNSSADTTLVVQRSDGIFVCNDDSEGLNPIVAGAFPPGQHRVWVGAYSQSSAGTPYTIGFSEIPSVTAASLGTPGGGAVAPAGFLPQDCGMAAPVYGPLNVGSSVVLGMHTPWTGPDGQGGTVSMDTNWTAEMNPFVGQRTTVTQLGGLDTAGCPGIRVAADNGQYFWRLRNVTF